MSTKAIGMDKRSQKVVESIQKAIELSGLRDGMTISFHHHFRNGDYIVNMVMGVIAQMGFKNLTLAASSLSDCHYPLIDHIKNGAVKRIETSGLRGELAVAISNGLMEAPITFRSHGGRANTILEGKLKIDVAFLGVPYADEYGNSSGLTRGEEGSSACGSLGYALIDAQYASKVVVLTDHLVSFPNLPYSIPGIQVDYVVKVDAVGDPKGIMSGATRFTQNPRELLIARNAANIIEASGYMKDGFSFQTGSGGSALAVTRFLRDKMIAKGIKASFALGGITGAIVALHEEGLIERLLDVQDFDLTAATSLRNNPMHQEVDAAQYANMNSRMGSVDFLDVVVLSALEIDVNFNINVLTGSDGVIRGAVGGHPDTADGARMTIVVAPLVRGRMPMVLDRVNTIVTPGSVVDVIVTDRGTAVNPARQDLIDSFTAAGISLMTIDELKALAEGIVGVPQPIAYGEKTVGLVTDRYGNIIDEIKQVLS